MTRLFWSLPVLGLLFACPVVSLPDGAADNEIVVGPQGGIFVRTCGGLNIPAGAFDTEQRIFVTLAPESSIPTVPGRARISPGCRLSPATLVPKVPLTIYLKWDPAKLVAGVDPGTYDLRRQTGSEAYTALPGAQTNTGDGIVEAKTDKLGLFWITSPGQPNVERLELDPEEAQLRVGDTKQFTGRVVSPTGETLDVPITWSVVPPRVASIDATGLLTATDPGIATVTARAGMQSATAKVYVQGTTVGPVTYVHENPFPTGNDLLGGAFAPAGLGTVYAGGNGTVLVESSTGAWSRPLSYPGLTLKAVAGTSLEDAVAIGQTGSTAVLIQFKGVMAPVVRVFQPTAISDLTALWFDGTHGMGVGTGNEVVIRRNGMWTTEYHPSFEALLSVIGDGTGGFTVVGDLGSIYKWDPARKVWDSLYDTRLAVKLDAAQLVDFATGEAWAVGANRLWHFVGTGWVAENLPATPALSKTTSIGLFDSKIFIGGEQRLTTMPLPTAKGVVLARSEAVSTDGGMNEVTWASFELRGQQVPRRIFGDASRGRVVGDLGAVWAWNATSQTFVETSKGFQGNVADLAVVDGDLFAAVNECADVRCTGRVGTVMHRAAAGGFEPLGTFPTTEPVSAIAARGTNEVVVASETAIWLWDGASWSALLTGTSGTIMDFAWCGERLVGPSTSGAVYLGPLTNLSPNTATFVPLMSAHCPTPTEIWVAGQQYLASNTGTNGWQQRASDSISQASWQAVWSPGPNEAFAFGDAMFGVYWDTEDLQLQDSTGPIGIDVTTAMWGNRIDNLYMAGLSKLPSVFGFMLRFDGVTWTLIDSGAHRKGTTLVGKSTNEIWLGTEGGGVLKAVPPN